MPAVSIFDTTNIILADNSKFSLLAPFLKPCFTMLDLLINSSTVSSSVAYSQAVVKAMLDTLTKEHTESLVKENKTVEDSTTSYHIATEKFEKLVSETQSFMSLFQNSF
ncbi:unnamed protein product [Lactuca saligna]|uniref:Uncharacterized protein n=1 Tax=Lactuca saligna TaxID=75948 RepID=A0AA35V548_LACSI|nr:unnamed protein product [Lactuca saligna]